MIGREFAKHMEHAEEFDGPQAGKVIYPFQYCPRFEARKTVLGPHSLTVSTAGSRTFPSMSRRISRPGSAVTRRSSVTDLGGTCI